MKRLILFSTLFLIGAMIITACGTPTTAVTSPAVEVATEAPPVIAEAPTEATPAEAVATITPEPTELPPVPQGKVRVTVFVGLGTGTDPGQIEAEKALADKFNSTHEKIDLVFLIVPNDVAAEKFDTMIAGGTAPQLVGPIGIESTSLFLDSLEDLTPYIQRDNYDTSDFYGPAATLNVYEGKNIGLPFGLYPSFIYYNKDAFDAAGVEYPTHDYNDTSWTIDKLREVAMQVTLDVDANNATSPDFDSTNIAQYGFDNSWDTLRGWEVMWGPANMGRPTGADYKTAIVNDPDWVTGLQWYSDGIWKDYFIPDNTALEAQGGDLFATGVDAMWMSNSWYFGLVPVDTFKWDIAPVPFNAKGKHVAQVDADVYSILKNAPNKDEAWEVMKWLLEPENNLELCKVYGCMPARKSTEADYKAYMAENYPNLDAQVMFDAANYLDIPNHESWVPEYSPINDSLSNAQQQILTIGQNHDAAAVLDITKAEIQKILDEYWANH